MMHVVVGALVWFLFPGPPGSSRSIPPYPDVNLKAGVWLQSHVSPARGHPVIGKRSPVVVFVFATADRQSARWARQLERLRRRSRGRIRIVGITADGRADALRFIRRNRVRFPVGAESQAARDLGVQKPPAVVVLMPGKAGRQGRARTVPLSFLEELSQPQDTRDTTDRPEIAELWTADDPQQRIRAARTLFEQIPGREFVRLASEAWLFEPDPEVRGWLEYLARVARGQRAADEDFRGASAVYLNEYMANPQAPEWQPVRQFTEHVDRGNPEALWAAYTQHRGENPADVLIRRLIVRDLQNLAHSPSRERARQLILDLIPDEPDDSIRLMATMALMELCRIGDTDAAALLEQYAEVEPNLRHVRPIMEITAYVLRTGDEDLQAMPAPIELGMLQMP